MHYEINVSLNGMHFFATAERSIQSEEKLIQVYNALKAAFPEDKGYWVKATYWQKTGKEVNMQALTTNESLPL